MKRLLIIIKPERYSCVSVRRLLISHTAAATYHREPFIGSRRQRHFKLTCQFFLNNIPFCPTQYQPPTNLASCACVTASDWSFFFFFFLPPTPTPLQAKAHRLRSGQCTSATCLSCCRLDSLYHCLKHSVLQQTKWPKSIKHERRFLGENC